MPEIPTRLEALARLIGLSEENKRLKETNAELAKTIDLLHVKIAALEARLAQNSTNSNRPPSSDSPQDRGSRPDRPATGRTRGGQRGHKGLKRNLLPAEKVNEMSSTALVLPKCFFRWTTSIFIAALPDDARLGLGSRGRSPHRPRRAHSEP